MKFSRAKVQGIIDGAIWALLTNGVGSDHIIHMVHAAIAEWELEQGADLGEMLTTDGVGA